MGLTVSASASLYISLTNIGHRAATKIISQTCLNPFTHLPSHESINQSINPNTYPPILPHQITPQSKNMSLTNPTKSETHSLFTTLESHFPASTLGASKWYILALAAIVAGGHPELAADLYLHLIARPEYSSPESRQALVRKLREVLVKLVSVIGVPKCIDAVFSIAGVEREEDRDWSFSR